MVKHINIEKKLLRPKANNKNNSLPKSNIAVCNTKVAIAQHYTNSKKIVDLFYKVTDWELWIDPSSGL